MEPRGHARRRLEQAACGLRKRYSVMIPSPSSKAKKSNTKDYCGSEVSDEEQLEAGQSGLHELWWQVWRSRCVTEGSRWASNCLVCGRSGQCPPESVHSRPPGRTIGWQRRD